MIKGDVFAFKDTLSLVCLFASVAAPARILKRAGCVFWIDAVRGWSLECAAGKCHFPLDVRGNHYTCFKTSDHMPAEMFSYLRPSFNFVTLSN